MKLLLPFNGTAHSHKVIPQARKLAERWGAEIVLMRAIDPLTFAGESFASLATKHLEHEMMKAAQDYLDGLAKEFVGLRTRTLCVVGPAPESIRAQAYREKCDLVLMAPYAYGAIVRWMIGSVAEGVAHIAPCPVMLIRGETGQEFRHIAVPVDGSQLSYSVLDHLTPFLKPDTRVSVIHCCGVPQAEVQQGSPAQAYLARLHLELADLVHDRPQTQLQVLESQAPEGILDWLKHAQCDLVAMSTHGNGGFQSLYAGSVTNQVARQSPCPVLVFPPTARV